jgi:flagellar M-ring protein FliF
VLSVPSGEGAVAGLTTRQLEIQRTVEQYLVDKIEGLLGTVVGAGRARAQVSALLSFDQVDRTIDTFDPDGQVLKTEQKSEGGTGGTDQASETVISNEYQNSRRLEKIVGSVGNIQRLTVAVLVDEKTVKAGGAPGGGTLAIDRLEAMVKNAIGVDSTRGDRVSVMAMAFEPAATPAAGTPSDAKPKPDVTVIVERVSRPLVGLAAIVALAFLALQAFRGGAGRPAAPAPPSAEALAAAMAANGEGVSRGGSNGNGERPETTAQVVRAWLAETR